MSTRDIDLALSNRSRVARLLAEAQGYAVCARDGERLGRLIWLTYAPDDPWPAGLRVQPPGSGERALAGSWEIPLAQVAFVRPGRREVVITAE